MALNEYLVKAERNCLGYVGGGAEKKTLSHWLKSKTCNRNFLVWLMLAYTARPRDTRILVPEKNRAAQNRAS